MNALKIVAILIVLLTTCQGEWARLKDATVVKVRGKKGDQIAILRSDGTKAVIPRTEVTGFLQSPAATRIVDDVMAKIGKTEHHDFVRAKLKQIGMAAVPHLLFQLQTNDIDKRRAAIAALQMAWGPEAKGPVKALLTDKDPYLRNMALRLVKRHFPVPERERALAPFADVSGDSELTGPALASLLRGTPDPKKMLTAMENPAFWDYLHPLLPRYQSPKFIPASLRLLQHDNPELQASALIALIYQMDHAAETRQIVTKRLTHTAPRVRELAAEYLRWHGTTKEVATLEDQSTHESDAHARAAIRSAIGAILRRSKTFTNGTAGDAIAWPSNSKAAYAHATQLLAEEPTAHTRDAVLELLTQPVFEPHFMYSGSALRQDPLPQKRLDLMSAAFAYPTNQERSRGSAAEDGELPLTQALMPPIRDYFDPERSSYGTFVPAGANVFGNSHHVADDVAFGQQQSTVVAIGDGIVRLAATGRPSWGGLIVIEHELADGSRFCSLYGHLGPLIEVMPGQLVKIGEKLGTLGRDHVHATGGYLTHLHLGTHKGPFAPDDGSRWITGYLPPEIFAKPEAHGWVDPQPFIRNLLAR